LGEDGRGEEEDDGQKNKEFRSQTSLLSYALRGLETDLRPRVFFLDGHLLDIEEVSNNGANLSFFIKYLFSDR
jgi:hypothetical protein